MDLYYILWSAFSLEKRPLKELLDLSSRIDQEKSQNGFYSESQDELSSIAVAIVALLNEKSTYKIGNNLYNSLNQLILEKNANDVELNEAGPVQNPIHGKKPVGKFRIRKTSSGYVFDLIAANGEFLLTSEVYSRPESCLNGVEAVKKYSLSHIEDQTKGAQDRVINPKFEVYMDKAGECRFRLKASNGMVIVLSEGYKDKDACMFAIDSIKSVAGSAETVID